MLETERIQRIIEEANSSVDGFIGNAVQRDTWNMSPWLKELLCALYVPPVPLPQTTAVHKYDGCSSHTVLSHSPWRDRRTDR